MNLPHGQEKVFISNTPSIRRRRRDSHGCQWFWVGACIRSFLAEEVDPKGQLSSAPRRLHQARTERAETTEILKDKASQLDRLQACQPGSAGSKEKFLREISRAKTAVEKAKVSDDHAFAQVLRAGEAHSVWRAITEVRELIKKHDGWFFDYSGLSPSDDELKLTSPSSQPYLTAVQFNIRRGIWKPFLQRFQDGRWIAKGRLANFGADPKTLSASLFKTPIRFHLPHSEIIEVSEDGARFVDVEVYSKDCLPRAMNSETDPSKTELPSKKGGRPPEKSIEYAFYRAFARYRCEGLPESKTRLVEDIMGELEALNEHAGPSTVRDWLVKHVKPLYEACSLPMTFDGKDK
jgi:hypothetical protein